MLSRRVEAWRKRSEEMRDRVLRYCQERDEMLRQLDPAKLEEHMARWNIRRPKQWAHPTVPLAMMHKARLQIRSFTPEEKMASARWLLEHGYRLPKGVELKRGTLIGAEYDQ